MAGGVGRTAAGGSRTVPAPAPAPARRGRRGRLILAALFALNLGLIFAWPWLGAGVRDALDPFYHGLCHRLPERCYVLGGEPLPACARCVGVWLGLTIMATVAALARLWRLRTGLLLLAWMLISWLLGAWLPAGWHAERTVAGVAGGLGLYVVATRAGRWAWRRVQTRISSMVP